MARIMEEYRYNKGARRMVRLFKARGWTDLTTSASPAYTDALLLSPCKRYVAKFAGGNSEAWFEFATWAAANPSPHLPTFYKVRKGKRGHRPVRYAIMERLHDLPYRGDAWHYDPRARASKREAELVREAHNVTRWSGGWHDAHASAPAGIRDALADVITRMATALGMPTDLHGKNIMLRSGPRGGARELVLLDPYS